MITFTVFSLKWLFGLSTVAVYIEVRLLVRSRVFVCLCLCLCVCMCLCARATMYLLLFIAKLFGKFEAYTLIGRFVMHTHTLVHKRRSCFQQGNRIVQFNGIYRCIATSESFIHASHVSFQMNAISLYVIILSSIKILATIPLFMLSLHTSFMLFGCLSCLLFLVSPSRLHTSQSFYWLTIFSVLPLSFPRCISFSLSFSFFFSLSPAHYVLFMVLIVGWLSAGLLIVMLLNFFQLFIDSSSGCQICLTYIHCRFQSLLTFINHHFCFVLFCFYFYLFTRLFVLVFVSRKTKKNDGAKLMLLLFYWKRLCWFSFFKFNFVRCHDVIMFFLLYISAV